MCECTCDCTIGALLWAALYTLGCIAIGFVLFMIVFLRD